MTGVLSTDRSQGTPSWLPSGSGHRSREVEAASAQLVISRSTVPSEASCQDMPLDSGTIVVMVGRPSLRSACAIPTAACAVPRQAQSPCRASRAAGAGADDGDEPTRNAGRQVPDRSHCHGFKAACTQTLEEMQEVSRYASGPNTQLRMPSFSGTVWKFSSRPPSPIRWTEIRLARSSHGVSWSKNDGASRGTCLGAKRPNNLLRETPCELRSTPCTFDAMAARGTG